MNRIGLPRFGLALVGASLLNLLLFALMQHLVRSDWRLPDSGVTDFGAVRWIDALPQPPQPPPQQPPTATPTPRPAPPEPSTPTPQPPSAPSAARPSAPQPVAAELPAADLPSIDSLLSQLPNALALPPAPAVPAPAPTILDNPVPRTRVPPTYPRMARRLGVSGFVVVAFTITRDGRVRDARVVESSPAELFDQSALRAIRAWSFEPPTDAGRPVEQAARQRFEFRLSD